MSLATGLINRLIALTLEIKKKEAEWDRMDDHSGNTAIISKELTKLHEECAELVIQLEAVSLPKQ